MTTAPTAEDALGGPHPHHFAHVDPEPDMVQLLTPEGERVENPDYPLEISDDEMHRDLVQPQRMTSLAIEPPDPNRRRDEQHQSRGGHRDDPLPTERKPGDRADERAETTHEQRIAWKKPPHPPRR